MTMQMNKKYYLRAGVAVLALAGLAKVLAAISFNPHAQPIGYVGQPVVSNSNVASGTAKIYSIDYNSNDWSGNLHSYPVTSAGAIDNVDDWGTGGASAQVKAQSVAGTRYIVTMKDGLGIPFQWADLSTAQRSLLDPAKTTPATTASPLVDYVRGSASNEGTGAGEFRPRAYGLGDMIHSTPVYWNDGVNRTVFVGANDGMLHAIDAATGQERFAYIPSVLIGRLGALASQPYVHQYYVDGRMDVKKFTTGSGASATSRTILTGTLGAGGKALFGLDVTNAAAASEALAAAKVLWEITPASTGFGDLGDTYSAPTLLTMPDATNTPALVVGNGYNNTGTTGHAVLYLVNATTGALIHAFDTGSGSIASPNGLSSPSLWDTNNDGKKDTAYAGDIDGHVWKFTLTAPYTASSVTRVYTNTAGAQHAITMAPGLSAHPLGGVMVTFVTGRMFTAADATNTERHFAYGIWDGAPAANDTLLTQTLVEATYTGVTPNIRVRVATTDAPNWTPGVGHHKGWKTELPAGGERVVGDGAFVTGSVFQFMSTNPTINPNLVPPGENWWMQLNVLTGGDTGVTQFDLNNDREFTSDDEVALAPSVVGRDPVGRHMGGGVRSQLIAISADGVDVFQSNYDKNSAPVTTPPVTETTTVVTGDRGVSGGHFDFDVYCYTNCGDGKGTTRGDGYFYIGRNSEAQTNNLYYTHVHEYDDIYDVTGVNMLAPSQGLFKLQRIKHGAAATAGAPAHLPDTPRLEADEEMPATGVTALTTTDPTVKTARNLPSKTFSYEHTTPVQMAGFPTTTSNGTVITTNDKTTYHTTLTTVEPVTTGPRSGNKWPYRMKKVVSQWDTVVTQTSTVPVLRFKVLVANQAYSPAVTLSLVDTTSTYDAKAWQFQNSAGLTAASLHTFRTGPASDLGAIAKMMVNMPLDAFKSKDWGNGTTRAGLHPTNAICVFYNPRLGPLGEWRNGALTIQIVDPNVTDSDIQLNVADRPELGYRIKASRMATRLIAEYTLFWHQPNNKCMGDTGYTITPPQDNEPSDAVAGVKAENGDPAGVFGGEGSGGNGTNPVLTPGTVTTTVNNADGTRTTTTVVTTANTSGGYTITTTVTTEPAVSTNVGIVTGGAVGSTGNIDTGGIDKNAATLGRITWRELQQ
ncbi:hypothetical protein CR105_07220 [Massilia eurypsychrophila]|jgi:type IV pilus assembly protein PilY1|uniref:PilY1 beta-propeller domain-containing protein n=2 Tax=Massilia eurypsychrophila TaxID=1485217 RepID=A0A2G8TIG6_9BURK|nr:hypothetical protein CR105_07220 [Massilia eurypsychrophila]